MKTIEQLVKHMKETYDVTITPEMQSRIEGIRKPTSKTDFPGITLIAPYRGQFGVHRIIEKDECIFSISDTFLTAIK